MAYCAYSRCGWGLFGLFYSYLSFHSSFSLSLGDGQIWTEILSQRAVKPQTTNQPAPGRPTIWITVRQGRITLAVGTGGCCLDVFTIIYPFSPLSPSFWVTVRYRLKYCLKGLLIPKQPTNQPTVIQIVGRCGTGSLPSTIAPAPSFRERELNAVGRHKAGFVQQECEIRSRSENDTDTAEMML